MALSVLRHALQSIADVIEAASTKRAAEDVRSIGTVLVGSDDRSATEAIADLERVMGLQGQLRRDSAIAQLNAANTDRAAFDAVIAELDKNKKITKDDVDAIAHTYTHGRTSWKSRKAAIDAIKVSFNDRAYQAAKMKIVEKAKVW
jgi:hypothetical protein